MEIDIQRIVSEDFWVDQLRGFEPYVFVPLKGKEDTASEPQYHLSPFPKSINDRLNEITKGIATNVYVLLGTAISIVLSKYTGTREILLVTPKLFSSQKIEEKDSILFLRLPVQQEATIRSLLHTIQTTVNKTHKHHDYNLDALLGRLNDNYDSDALFQVGFSYSGLNQSRVLTDKVPLLFHIEESLGKYSLSIAYKDGVFHETIINQIAATVFRALEFVLWHPDDTIGNVKLLSASDVTTLVEEFNATQTWYPQHQQVIDWFEEQVELNPDAVAIVCEQRKLSYRDLNQRANQVAAYLKTNGIEFENRVGLLLTRSEYLIIAILGVLKAGGAYLPIDPELPFERIQYMVADSGCQIILSDTSQQELWACLGTVELVDIREIPTKLATNPKRSTHPNQLAYLMYTSGSTGLPKGVAIEHSSLMNYLYWASKYYFAVNPKLGNMALFTSPAFDLTVTTIFLPLLRGKTLYIYQENSPEVVLETCFRADTEVDTIKLTPSHIQILNYIPVTPSNIELVIVGGEELKPNHVQVLKERNPEMRVYNEYGPTETTVGCTVTECSVKKTTIGKPIANTQIYILNEESELLPVGVTGEICIGGEGLARGYWNRQELTAQRFVTHPFSEEKRIYRTGDLGRWLPEGELEYLGRKDNQVKIRGYRIELQEIEQQLLQCDGISEVAIITHELGEGDKELVAYVVGPTDLNVADVGIHLTRKLPVYMVPQHIIRLSRLPLMANGKLDRKALPKPEELKQSLGYEYEAPRSQLEAQLVEICGEILNQNKIGIKDNFLALGANSLKIIQMASRVSRWLGVELNWREIFANLSVKELAEVIQGKQQMQSLTAIEKVPLADHYALSPAQQQLWLSAQIGAAVGYNIPGAVLMEGQLDKQALQKAFKSIVSRQEVLRTTFICVNGEPRQRINQDIDFWLGERDLSGEADPKSTAWSIMEEEVARPFDLEKGPLLRVQLLRLGQMEHILLLNTHHIIFDGWSIGLLLQELTTLYEAYRDGQDNPLKPLEFQYKDYAAWQNALLNGDRARLQKAYWHQKLRGSLPLDLPTDYPRPAIQTFKGAIVPLTLSSHLLQNLEKFSQEQQVSQFAIALAVLKTLLYRYTGKEDIIVATPVSERTQIDWETQIGLYLNTVVLRDTISGQDRFIDVTQRIKQTALEAFAHQAYPFHHLVQELDIPRDPSRNAVFDVGYTWMDEIGSQLDRITLSNLKLTQIPLDREQKIAVSDLWFYFEKRVDSIEGYLAYNCNLFRKETIYFLRQAFITIFNQVLNNPEIEIRALNFMDEKESCKTQVTVELSL
ncbi:hypothetical protein NUACC21_69020 [Scytonema sp. NUACC21]